MFLWVLPQAPTVSVISGSTFQPLSFMSLISPRYLLVFSWILFGENLSLQYENSMNCIVSVRLGSCSGSALYGWFHMHSISSLNLALQLHLCVWLLQQHGNSQFGTVISCIWPSCLSAFTRVKHRDLVLDINNL